MTQPVDIEALRALMERAPDLDELRNDLSMPATAALLDALPSLLTELEALRAERGRMVEAARNLLPYLRWTVGEENPGFHPTMPSAVAAFEATLKEPSQ
ncbi:hypothetical protein ACGGKE_07785 [Sphingobium naphthae]|uniref:hypothetical protein n=1 Tax=Sphingobium naphthae TaxID=1886786 RepID=UPI0037483B67